MMSSLSEQPIAKPFRQSSMRLIRRTALSYFFLMLATQSLTAQVPQQRVDWDKMRDETVQVLTDYLKINTTNPPGNERQTPRFLKRILEREGIDAQILDTADLKPAGRANLYARLKGNGSKKAIA